jgi:hypothetical protein
MQGQQIWRNSRVDGNSPDERRCVAAPPSTSPPLLLGLKAHSLALKRFPRALSCEERFNVGNVKQRHHS